MATWTVDAVIGAVDGIAALCNGGSVKFHDSDHTVLCSCSFSATAFAAATAEGVAQAAAIAVSAGATAGTIDHAHIYKSNGTTALAELTCDDEAGTDLVFSPSLVLGEGDTVFIQALSISG